MMLFLFWPGIAFLFGLFVGSFLNVVICRLHTGESILLSRSCKKSISWQYPLVEASTGLLFLLVFSLAFLGGSFAGEEILAFNAFQFFQFLYLLVVSSGLVVIFVYDLKHYLITDIVLFSLFGVTLLALLFGIWNTEFLWNFKIGVLHGGNIANGLVSGTLATLPFLGIV